MADIGATGFIRSLLSMSDLTKVMLEGMTDKESKETLATVIAENLPVGNIATLMKAFSGKELSDLPTKLRKLASEVEEHGSELRQIAIAVSRLTSKVEAAVAPVVPKKAAPIIIRDPADQRRVDTALEQVLPLVQAKYAEYGKKTLAPTSIAQLEIGIGRYGDKMISGDNWMAYFAKAIKNEKGQILMMYFLVDAAGNISKDQVMRFE